MSKLQEAYNIAKESWVRSDFKNGPCLWCFECGDYWRRHGGGSTTSKPPIFPIDYKGVCPIHNKPLSPLSFGMVAPFE